MKTMYFTAEKMKKITDESKLIKDITD